MIENLKLREKNNNKKIKKNPETRIAVHTHTHTLCCHLENKKTSVYRFVKFNKKIRDRTIQKYSIGLSFCVFIKKSWKKLKKFFSQFLNTKKLNGAESEAQTRRICELAISNSHISVFSRNEKNFII